MIWEGRTLREITEADVRRLVEGGMEEHLHLEYKSDLYEPGDRGARELLLDTCMFANAEGGILLIGIPERRDGQGQPTGEPEPSAPLGIANDNPDSVLLSYDSRIVSNIEERIRLEAASIPTAGGRHVLALRIPNSTAKPHCVRYQGRVYFPSRRERNRYDLDVREIKELTLRTASRLDRAKDVLNDSLQARIQSVLNPQLFVGIIPIFHSDFMVDLRTTELTDLLTRSDPLSPERHEYPEFTFMGIQRDVAGDGSLLVQRNGAIIYTRKLPISGNPLNQNFDSFHVSAIDQLLRGFALRVTDLYKITGISGPYLLTVWIHSERRLVGLYAANVPGFSDQSAPIEAGKYHFPMLQLDDLANVDIAVRPLCDSAHQMFGRRSSPNFTSEGTWIQRR